MINLSKSKEEFTENERKELLELSKNIKILPTIDVVFKAIFKDSKISSFFLSKITDLDVKSKDISYYDTESKLGLKSKRVKEDILIKVLGPRDTELFSTFVGIEMQNYNVGEAFRIRLQQYLAHAYANTMDEGYIYKREDGVPKAYILAFVNSSFNKSEKIIQEYILRNEDNNDSFSGMYIYIVDLTKLEKYDKLKIEDIDLYDSLKYFITGDETLEGGVVKDMAKIVNKFTTDEQKRFEAAFEVMHYNEYERGLKESYYEGEYNGKAEGKAEGIAEGRIEGEKRKENEMIQTMHSNGATIEDISRLLNLEKDYVKKVLDIK